jgi:hypothetical protein
MERPEAHLSAEQRLNEMARVLIKTVVRLDDTLKRVEPYSEFPTNGPNEAEFGEIKTSELT